ncbi:hypothetical protein Mal15_40610 [Stieleria maiorica]|uniref:Cohesin domain-containing protein n=1 Tax=Stieleria maiorica TaxID=2795974 RepID=A0A5B9MK01_9BACT|nr:hypothetical protein [Stieleria maiorica]QEF99994.1 hypothetical protein Mal15_40610 [Stieleria maiorica]
MALQTRRLAAERLECRRLLASVSVAQSWNESERELSLPFRVERANDLRAAEIQIRYDPDVIRTDDLNIQPGPIWNGDVAMAVKIDHDSGTVTAFLFSADPVQADAGEVVSVGFQEKACVSDLRSAPIHIAQVRVNENVTQLSVAPPVPQDRVVDGPRRDSDRALTSAIHRNSPPMGPLRPTDVDTLMSESSNGRLV